MSNGQLDYYGILGLSVSATPEQVKKKYRELARRYHPDINPSAEAAGKIKGINEAYHVLGDADRRAVYDATLLLSRPAAQQSARSAQSAPGSRQSAQSSPRSPSNVDFKVEFDGFGTTARRSSSTGSSSAKPPPRRPSSQERATEMLRQSGKLVAEAQLAFINRQYAEAEKLCQQALGMNRDNAVAHEILGDIFTRRGDRELANTAYSYAIQFNPRNQAVQAKLDRLSGVRTNGRTGGPTMTRTVSQPLMTRILTDTNRDFVIGAMSGVLGIGLIVLLGWFAKHPGTAVYLDISFELIGAALTSGIISGILLALYGGMRPMSQELAPREGGTRSGNLGLLLTLAALLWFYLSLLFYVVIALNQKRTSYSILRAYGVSMILTVLFAFLYRPDGIYVSVVSLFAGNLLFPMVLLGWKFGDALRLSRR